MSEPTRLRGTCAGGAAGEGRVTGLCRVVGEALAEVARLAPLERSTNEPFAAMEGSVWQLHGVTSYERYTHVEEHAALVARQQPLGRPEATRAALIPITKSAAWWALSQD